VSNESSAAVPAAVRRASPPAGPRPDALGIAGKMPALHFFNANKLQRRPFPHRSIANYFNTTGSTWSYG